MELCVIDWTAVAAWVQGIGSIGAIGVAIWIGNRQHKQSVALVQTQHRQNLDLIEHEQSRLRELSEQQDIEDSRDLKQLVLIVFNPLMTGLEERFSSLRILEGNTAPLSEESISMIRRTAAEAETIRNQLMQLREAFLGKPRTLLAHGHLVGALRLLENVCHGEVSLNEMRVLRQTQIAQTPLNGSHVALTAEQPFRTQNLERAIQFVQSTIDTIGR